MIPIARRSEVEQATAGRPAHLTLAVSYAALPGGPVKDIDLVIRTSGERRLSGFFPWQTARAKIFTCPKMWPAFSADDFADALAHYSDRAERLPVG